MDVGVLADVVDGDDVGVGEVGGGLGLAAEAGYEGAVAGVLFAEDLDGDYATEDVVASLVDGGHTAATDGGDEGIAAIEDAADAGPTGATGAVYAVATFVCTRQRITFCADRRDDGRSGRGPALARAVSSLVGLLSNKNAGK
jgi:hypothetical protein